MIQDRSTRFIVGLGSHACAMGVQLRFANCIGVLQAL
jgi:hypothetical protein